MEGKDEKSDNSRSSRINNTYINCPTSSYPIMGDMHPFYYCKEHLKFQNIHLSYLKPSNPCKRS